MRNSGHQRYRSWENRMVRLRGNLRMFFQIYSKRVTYDKQEENVALCLKTSPDVQEQKVMTRIAEIFSGMFNRNEQLDIVFLTEKNQKQIAEVCPPFFVLNLT